MGGIADHLDLRLLPFFREDDAERTVFRELLRSSFHRLDGKRHGAFRFARDRVHDRAGLQADLRRVAALKGCLRPALLRVRQGIFPVGRDGKIGRRAVRQEVFEALHAGLLVAAEDDVHVLLQFIAAFQDGLERPEGRHGRTLVVDGAAAVQSAVRDDRPVRRIVPACGFRHDVQMGKDAERFRLAALRVIRGNDDAAAVAVHALAVEAEALRDAEGFLQAVVRDRPERLARFGDRGLVLHGAVAQQRLQIRDDFRLVFEQPLIDSYVFRFHNAPYFSNAFMMDL